MNATDRLFLRFGASLTNRAAFALVMLPYLGIGLALPLALYLSVGRLVAFNLAGTTLGWLVFVAWIAAQAQHRGSGPRRSPRLAQPRGALSGTRPGNFDSLRGRG